MKSTNGNGSARHSFGVFEFDPTTLELFRSGDRVPLAMQPALMLRLLLQKPGQLVTRDEIRNELWPEKVVDFEQSINACVRQLRRALEDDADTARYVETLPRLGYRFIHPLAARKAALAKAAVAATFAVLAVAAVFFLTDRRPSSGVSAEAFEAYQKGLHLVEQPGPDEKMRGIRFLEESVALQADYVDAWAALADAWLNYPDRSEVVGPNARRAAQRALETDPDHPDALLQLAHVKFLFDWDWLEAGNLYRNALELDPDNADAHQAYASWLYVMNRPGDAEGHLKRVEELDPLSAILYTDRSWYFMVQGRYAEALENCRQLAEVAADRSTALLCPYRIHIESGEFAAAAALAREVLVHVESKNDWLSKFDAARGQDALDVFNEFRLELLQCESSPRAALSCALTYSDLGRTGEALAHLAVAVENRDLMLPFLALYPEFRTMHETHAFQDIAGALGLDLEVATTPGVTQNRP